MTQKQTATNNPSAVTLYDIIMQELEPDLLEVRIRDGTAWKKRESETDEEYAVRITRYQSSLDALENILDHLERSEEVATAHALTKQQRQHAKEEEQHRLQELENQFQ